MPAGSVMASVRMTYPFGAPRLEADGEVGDGRALEHQVVLGPDLGGVHLGVLGAVGHGRVEERVDLRLGLFLGGHLQLPFVKEMARDVGPSGERPAPCGPAPPAARGAG
jgi:hypothetical protein